MERKCLANLKLVFGPRTETGYLAAKNLQFRVYIWLGRGRCDTGLSLRQNGIANGHIRRCFLYLAN